MAEFMLLMHNDADEKVIEANWPPYLEKLGALGVLRGGSAIGSGCCLRRKGSAGKLNDHISGYVKIEISNMSEAVKLLEGNPIYEAGGTIEIRDLPQDKAIAPKT